ncbi:PQQ-binding-like beta-propeller repeat protein [bacterium]|nr:PQQ-binding-like beta-propeller repeat protein [bacterium]
MGRSPNCHCHCSTDFNLIKVDPDRGRVIWRRLIRFDQDDEINPCHGWEVRPLHGTNDVVMVVSGGAVSGGGVARVSAGGSVRWITSEPNPWITSGDVSVGKHFDTSPEGGIYFLDQRSGGTHVTSLNPDDGSVLWRVPPPSVPAFDYASLAVNANGVYALANNAKRRYGFDGSETASSDSTEPVFGFLGFDSSGVLRVRSSSSFNIWLDHFAVDLSTTERIFQIPGLLTAREEGDDLYVMSVNEDQRRIGKMAGDGTVLWDAYDIVGSKEQLVQRIDVASDFVAWGGVNIFYQIDGENVDGKLLITDKDGVGLHMLPWGRRADLFNEINSVCISDDGYIYASGWQASTV